MGYSSPIFYISSPLFKKKKLNISLPDLGVYDFVTKKRFVPTVVRGEKEGARGERVRARRGRVIRVVKTRAHVERERERERGGRLFFF